MPLPARLARYDAMIDLLVAMLVEEFDSAQAVPSVDVDPEPNVANGRAPRSAKDDVHTNPGP